MIDENILKDNNHIPQISFNEENSINVMNLDEFIVEHNDKNENKIDLKDSCFSIFMNFSKFCKEDLQFTMNYQNLIKLLKSVNIIGKEESVLKNFEIDAILKKINPQNKKYTLKHFMNFIVLLSFRIDPALFKKDKKSCVQNVMKKYFEPLIPYIEDQISSGTTGEYFQNFIVKKYINSVQIDYKIVLIFNSIHNGLKNLYKSYFHFENNHMNEEEKIFRNSLIGLLEFCKDFEITNYIISVERIVNYFNFFISMAQEQVTKNVDCPFIFDKNKECGKLFTISKLAAFLVHISIINFEKNSKSLEALINKRKSVSDSANNPIENFGNAEKLILLLDKFDHGEGIKILEKRTTKCYSSRITLMPSKEIIMNVN